MNQIRGIEFPTYGLRTERPLDGLDPGVRELIAVREVAHAFLTADRPEEVFQFALDRVSPLVGAKFACVYAVDGSSELMRLAAVHHWPQRYAAFLGEMRVRVGFGPSGKAASERCAVEVADVFADPSLEDWQEVASELGFRSLVALPLDTGHLVLGTVTFYFGEAVAMTPESRSLLRTVADQMAATAQKATLIDDLRRANAALHEANAELERQFQSMVEARQLKDEFLSNISHELRTPLTAVIGYIALLQEGLAGPVTEEQHRSLSQVKQASEQLLALIGDLLDLTSLSGGSIQVHTSAFDAREALREALGTTKGRADGVGLRVAEPDLPIPTRSDRTKIVRILGSLLSNAYKFTHAGEVRAALHADGERVVYTVEDTGIGIGVEAQAIVFDDFRQVDGSATRRYGGTGIGLALARRLAQLLGGDIILVSQPGIGSSFRVELPLEYVPPV